MSGRGTQTGFGIEAVELGGFDQRVGCGGALAAHVGPGEQRVFPAHMITMTFASSGPLQSMSEAYGYAGNSWNGFFVKIPSGVH